MKGIGMGKAPMVESLEASSDSEEVYDTYLTSSDNEEESHDSISELEHDKLL